MSITWNTGSAAARYRLKNKKKIKPQATSGKRQASSNKRLTKQHYKII
tara:strand:- start:280 stop:423 length:144 start_codon:yes stop_codon:yes gene_type:complete